MVPFWGVAGVAAHRTAPLSSRTKKRTLLQWCARCLAVGNRRWSPAGRCRCLVPRGTPSSCECCQAGRSAGSRRCRLGDLQGDRGDLGRLRSRCDTARRRTASRPCGRGCRCAVDFSRRRSAATSVGSSGCWTGGRRAAGSTAGSSYTLEVRRLGTAGQRLVYPIRPGKHEPADSRPQRRTRTNPPRPRAACRRQRCSDAIMTACPDSIASRLTRRYATVSRPCGVCGIRWRACWSCCRRA